MTRQQWIIVATLGIGVLCVYCAGVFVVAQQMLGADVQIANLFVATPTTAATATRVFAPPPPPPTRTPAPLTGPALGIVTSTPTPKRN